MRTLGDDCTAASSEPRPDSLEWRHALLRIGRIVIASAFLGWLWSGITVVSLDEVALYERLGRIKEEPLAAGWHFLLPPPWGHAHRYPRSRIQLVAIDVAPMDLSPDDAGETEARASIAGSDGTVSEVNDRRSGGVTLLCGSTTEVIQLRAQVAYRPVDTGPGWRSRHLSETDPEKHLRRMADRLLSRAASTRTLDSLLGRDKAELSRELTQSLQTACSDAQLGLEVLALEIVEASPPAEVTPYFLDVTSAAIDAERDLENARIQALGELNRMSMMSDSLVADAKGTASAHLTAATTQAITLQALADSYGERIDTVRHRMQMERWGELLGQRRVVLWDADLSSSVSLSLDESNDAGSPGVSPGATP